MNGLPNGMGRSARKGFEVVALFFAALAISLGIFWVYNAKLHNRSTQIESETCKEDYQLAQNQKKVIQALLALADAMYKGDAVAPYEILAVRKALLDVPIFDCPRPGSAAKP